MDKTAARSRAARLLAVLAVLLGLLAMHGVASAHHAAATPVPGHAPGTVSERPVAETAHLHDHSEVQRDAALRLDPGALAGPVGSSCHDDCPSVAALCVAVLTGVAVALLLARRRAARLVLARVRRSGRAPAPLGRHARGPDSVRELCVSRT